MCPHCIAADVASVALAVPFLSVSRHWLHARVSRLFVSEHNSIVEGL
jgi:hypothetical protein